MFRRTSATMFAAAGVCAAAAAHAGPGLASSCSAEARGLTGAQRAHYVKTCIASETKMQEARARECRAVFKTSAPIGRCEPPAAPVRVRAQVHQASN